MISRATTVAAEAHTALLIHMSLAVVVVDVVRFSIMVWPDQQVRKYEPYKSFCVNHIYTLDLQIPINIHVR